MSEITSSNDAETKIAYLEPKHEEQVRALFQEVFDETMSSALWNWKYGNDKGRGGLVFRDGNLVAHYGAIIVDALYRGEKQQVIQIADVMVKKEARQSVRSQSAFFLAAKAFIEKYVGYDKTFLIGYGFPHTRAMKIAERVKVYAEVGRMCEITYPTGASLARLVLKGKIINAGNYVTARPLIERVWQKMAGELQDKIVPVKDGTFVKRRYIQHPEQDYELHLVSSKLSNKVLGLVVLKYEAERVLVMDLIGSFEHFPALIRYTRGLGKVCNKGALVAWCCEAFTDKMLHNKGTVKALPMSVPTNIWSNAPGPEELKDAWWLMPGDTDFL